MISIQIINLMGKLEKSWIMQTWLQAKYVSDNENIDGIWIIKE